MIDFHPSKLLAVMLIALLVGAPLHAATIGAAAPGGTFDESLRFDGRERDYRVHVPPGIDADDALPVLIVLHGGGGNGLQMERKSGFSELADANGFIAVYPDGTGRLDKRLTWNAYGCCAYALDQQVDDAKFISALIDQLIVEYPVDPARIYVTGHSNGAMMTFRLACELSDKIAAAAPYAGALDSDTCAATSPVPILIMNGAADENVPVAGGASPNVGFRGEDDRIDKPTSFAVDTWVALNGCDPAPAVMDSSAATISTHGSCTDGATVEQILIHGWPHSWPDPVDGSPVDGSQVIWDFVSQFSKPAN